MRQTVAVALMLLLSASCVPAQEEGLVAHYTFDEGSGAALKDVSGNGHDGQITGATYVESPRGHALQFDGVDDYVYLGEASMLNLTGDLTIEVWLRATDISGRNRLIIGDAAGLTVNRNFSLRIDKQRLRFEYGEGHDYGMFLADESFPTGEWHHLAIVCEFPRYFFYFDGKKIKSGALAFPITPTQGGQRLLGGWGHGRFKGEIDEIRVYNKALSERLVMKHFSGEDVAPTPEAELETRLAYSQRRATVVVRCSGPMEAGGTAELRLLRAGQDEPAKVRTGRLRETRAGSERWVAEFAFATEGLPPGEYRMEAVIKDAVGDRVTSASTGFPYLAEDPDWLSSPVGVTDRVLLPFTDVRAERTEGGVEVSVWGRKYSFGAGPSLAQVESAGAELLAGPVRVIAEAEGKELSWEARPAEALETSAARVSLSQALSGEPLELRAQTVIEYDGLVRTDLRVRAKRRTSLQRLAVEVPLKAEHARYIYAWPTVRSGELRQDYASAFKPIVWLGDEERGLSWLCESDEDWRLAEPKQAIRVSKGDAEVVLRLNLIDTPTELDDGDELAYDFGFQATPLKPIDKDAWDYRIVRHPWYGHSLSLGEKEVEGKPALQHFADKGVRALIVWRLWEKAFSYPLPLGCEAEFRALVKMCHDHGIKVVPYVGGFLLSEHAPEAPFFTHEMAKAPITPFPLSMPGLPPHVGYIVCQKSIWQDFLVAGIARLIDEYDVDGVYLDSTTIPWACRGEAHGCGYRRADGAVSPTYPVFSVRETLRRIYSVVKERKPDGIVDMHVYDCMNGPALAFCTTYWNGEQLRRGEKHKPAALPLDRFRTEFMGHNWGVPADLLYYVLGGNQACWALTLLHDVPVRAENLKDLDTQASLWDLRESFGVKEARWLPYWSNSEYVSVHPDGCYASLYHHPQNGVLAFVSNLGTEAAAVEIGLDRGKLGLGGALAATDGLSGEALAMEDGRLKLELPSQGWKTVLVEPTPAR